MKNCRHRYGLFDELHDEGRILPGGRIADIGPDYAPFYNLPKDKPCPICQVLLNKHSKKQLAHCAVEYVDP